MTQHAFRKFGELAAEHPDVLNDVREKGIENRAGLIEVAEKHGFSITEDDFRAAIKEHQPELSEEELEQIAGGTTTVAVAAVAVGAVGAGAAVAATTHGSGW